MFHRLEIEDVTLEPGNAVRISLRIPPEITPLFVHKPGQYLTLRRVGDTTDERRCYSICSARGEALSVGIKAVPGGQFSLPAQGYNAGDMIDVMPPQGRFCPKGEHHALLIAAGSGITPMVAIAADRLLTGQRVTLILGNRTSSQVMLLDALIALKDQHLDRFRILHHFSQEQGNFGQGRLNTTFFESLIQKGMIRVSDHDGLYLCGPSAMMNDARAVFQSAGLAGDNIFSEQFTTHETETAPIAPMDKPSSDATSLTIRIDGAERLVEMRPTDASILTAAQRAGIDLPFSCKGGMCCTCRCKVVSGAVDLPVNYSLEPWEIAAGFTLACQARVVSDDVVLDFDEV